MLTKREAGVLLNISSLPGPFGIGTFGEEACDFIDRLADMGFSVWQVLPFNMLDGGKSPYGSPSAFAVNYLYIDPRGLQKQGLVTAAEADACRYPDTPYTTDYVFAETTRLTLLEAAYARRTDSVCRAMQAFAASHGWVADFTLYMAAKEANGAKPWWEWTPDTADHDACKKQSDRFAARCDFWLFVQTMLFEQWGEVQAHARARGIRVLGDMPMYVAMDSADVWSHLPLFRIDRRTFRPDKIAGVPPDYFSADGQLWGNPLYDWDAMEKDGYRFWIDRVKTALVLYDAIRIDHFRAMASYWAVPATAATAREGTWEKGPGKKLFDAVLAACEQEPLIVAEDLGTFGEDVVCLLKDTGFPGMRVVQFGFDPGGDSTHLPHNYPFNCIAYVGTHDNNTLLGWLWEASEEERRFALDYCGFSGDNWGEGGYYSPSCRKIIETVWRSSARLAIISFQDMCGFGSDARMNIPGVPEKNWRFRTTRETFDQLDRDYFRRINRLYRRG